MYIGTLDRAAVFMFGSITVYIYVYQIKSNHTVGVVQQLTFDTRETTSRNPNTIGVFSLTNSTSVGRRKSRTHDKIGGMLPV